MTPRRRKKSFSAAHFTEKKLRPAISRAGLFLRSLRVPAAAEKPAGEKISPAGAGDI